MCSAQLGHTAKDLHVDILYDMLSDIYNLYPLYVDLADVGHAGAARKRVYVIVVSKQYRVIADPQLIYEDVAAEIRQRFSTSPADYLTASLLEIRYEAMELARALADLQFSGLGSAFFLGANLGTLNRKPRGANLGQRWHEIITPKAYNFMFPR